MLTEDVAVENVVTDTEPCSEVVEVNAPRIERPHQSTAVVDIHTDDIFDAIVPYDCVGVPLTDERKPAQIAGRLREL